MKKTVNDLWKEFKLRSYGKDIGNISRNQLVESEWVFKMAIAAVLIHLRDDISELSEEEGSEELKNMMVEIMLYAKKRAEQYELEKQRS